MHPILFWIGSYGVPAYGAALLVAFAVGIAVATARARRQGLDAERVLDVSILILVASIAGSRLLWVATHLDRFRPPRGAWTDALNPLHGGGPMGAVGLSMQGGVALAIVSALLFLVHHRLPVLKLADVLAPSVALGEGITRIGCFLNGCCHGRVCELPWGVAFPVGSQAAALFPGAAVHPTQLYASLVGFATFGLLLWLARRKPFDGTVAFAFLAVSGVARIGLDLVRYYPEQAILFRVAGAPLTIHGAFALAFALAGVVGLTIVRQRGVSGAKADPPGLGDRGHPEP